MGVEDRFAELGIDGKRSTEILDKLNAGVYDHIEAVRSTGIPEIDGTRIIDRRTDTSREISDEVYRRRLSDLAPEIPADAFGSAADGMRTLHERDLRDLGVLLYPYVAYGVLNGGSATSYADRKKNSAFDGDLFNLFESRFDAAAPDLAGRPKGITPAFFHPDGTAGPAFLELKFRHLLRARRDYLATAETYGIVAEPLDSILPFFEMTSGTTSEPLQDEYRSYRHSPLLAAFPDAPGLLETIHREQPLLAAFTHSEAGKPRRFFDSANGEPDTPLGLPGGHGQNFSVLAPVYRSLRAQGKRFAYLGNVDNIGFTVDPVGIALTALSGAQAAFDFAFRTPVDVKGGVLIYDQNGGINCADIGAAISRDDVFAAEAEGARILFNCATGLFNLDYLAENIDTIAENLPMRISDQEKDAGRYSQAEQVTWEIIGMLDDFLVFGIDKYRRFLAAKMFLDTLMTSGYRLEEAEQIQPTARTLNDGLSALLSSVYGMELQGERWVPRNER